MSSMTLQPIVLEACQGTSLRDRRRSSIRPQRLLPLLFPPGTSIPTGQAESALIDELFELPSATLSRTPVDHANSYSALPDALGFPLDKRPSGTRRLDSDFSQTTGKDSSPASTAINSRAFTSLVIPRLRWRLASAFLLYFLNGWGDGGSLSLIHVEQPTNTLVSDWHCTTLSAHFAPRLQLTF